MRTECHLRRVVFLLVTILLVSVSGHRGGFSQTFPLVIDPGHGGVDPGCTTAVAGYWEKDANLSVALRLGDSLHNAGYQKNLHYLFTRENDSTKSLQDRADFANSWHANEFISVHHNPNIEDLTTNYTRVYYSTRDTTDGGMRRDTSALLASKVGHRIEQSFRLPYSPCSYVSWPCQANFYVLRNTTMASVISEASFLTNPDEANAFAYGTRAQQEAGAIFHGWRSYITGEGLATVRNSYNGGTDGTLGVDNEPGARST